MFIAAFRIFIFLCTVTTVWVIHRSSFRFWPLPLPLQKFSESYWDCQRVGRIPWKEDLTIATSLYPQQNKNRKGNVCPNSSLRHLTEYLFLVHDHLLTQMKSQDRKATCMTFHSQKRFSFISYIAKNLSHKMSQIEVVNILDHFMPYSTALYEEPFLATFDTLEFDHLRCVLYNSQVNIKLKIAICLYCRTSVFSSIKICWVDLKTRRADRRKGRRVIPIMHPAYALLQRNCIYISLDSEPVIS